MAGLAELGGFGLSVPEEYGGFASGGESDYLAMVVATEELSWGSLGVGGSLITRPEILTRAIVAGGTEEQKQRWLPRIASGELLVGVSVTEPDFGSDVAGCHHDGHRGRRRLPHQRREDLGDVRRARRAHHAARAHRSRPFRRAPRAVALRRREGRGARPLVRAGARRRRQGRGTRHRHHRVPRHALVRGVVRRLVRPCREPRGRGRRVGPWLLPPDGGIRERAPPDRGARRRPHAGGVRRRASRTRASASCSVDRCSTTSSAR